MVLEPLDFIARLTAPVLSARVNLTRFHGAFAPHHWLRAQIVPAQVSAPANAAAQGGARSCALGWAQRLKRVFGIDIQKCEHCRANVLINVCFRAPISIRRLAPVSGQKTVF